MPLRPVKLRKFNGLTRGRSHAWIARPVCVHARSAPSVVGRLKPLWTSFPLVGLRPRKRRDAGCNVNETKAGWASLMRLISRRGLIAGGAAALVPQRAFAQTPLLFTPHPLAFVAIEVGGAPAIALIDTGGSRGVQISGNLAGDLRVELSDAGPTTQRQNGAISIRTGTIDVSVDDRAWMDEEVSVAAGDIERIALQIGRSFDAILGWHFLSREGFVADFAGGRFSLGGGASAQPIAFDDTHGLPIATGVMDGAPLGVLIDTGAPACVLDATLAGGESARVRKTLALGAHSFETDFRVRDLSALSHATGAKAVLGLNVMRTRRLAFDAHTRSLTLE